MYAALHHYRVRLGTVAEAGERAQRALVPLLRRVAAFVAYYLLDAGNDTVVSLALFDTREAAEGSTPLLSDWFRSDWPAFRQIPPDGSVGELLVVERVTREAEPAPPDDRARTQTDRQEVREPRRAWDRRMFDRRAMQDRRQEMAPVATERRGEGDRRRGLDRRSGLERRAAGPVPAFKPGAERRRIAPLWRRREAHRST